jgi:hypothetical protein
VHRRRSVLTTHAIAGLAFWPVALAVGACLVLSGCSPGVDYPSLFPAVHDMPPPRADAPMDQNQVQQATEALIADRNHLNAEAQGGGQANASSPAPASGATQGTAKYQPASTANAKPAASAAQTAGTETK